MNSTADVPDAALGDGICDTGTGSGGAVCTLRAAVQEANALGSATLINLPAGMYSLSHPSLCTFTTFGNPGVQTYTGPVLCLAGQITISGASAASTIIDGGGLDRTTFVSANASVEIDGVTIQNGFQQGGTFIGGGAGINNQGALKLNKTIVTGNHGGVDGGGVFNAASMSINDSSILLNTVASDGGGLYNTGTLTISQTTIQNNSAAGQAGGLFNFSGSASITESLFNQNSAGGAGGIFNFDAILNLVNSTITGNTALGGSAGLAIAGAFANVNLNNVTIARNASGGSSPGGLTGADPGESITIANSIIANNSSLGAQPDCTATLTSNGHNLIQHADSLCAILGDTTGNIIGQDPKLGLLADFGGPTQSISLDAGSPAIDAGSPATPGSGGSACAIADQRGVVRPQGSACDIGAFETQGGFLVTAVTPDHAGNSGSILALVSGNGFTSSSTVKLDCGAKSVAGAGVSMDQGGSLLSVSFNLTGVAPSSCSVTVSNPDGTSKSVTGVFTVENATGPQVWAEILGPSKIRVNTPSVVQVLYGNRGNVDALGVALGFYVTSNIAPYVNVEVETPPSQPGDPAVDWSTVPIKAISTRPGFYLFPLVLPVVPVGFTGIVQFVITTPSSIHGQAFSIEMSIGPATASPTLSVDPVFVQDFLAGAHTYAQNYLQTAIPSSQDAQLRAQFISDFQNLISTGRSAFQSSIMSKPRVYSFGQVLFGLVAVSGAAGGGTGGGTGGGGGSGKGGGITPAGPKGDGGGDDDDGDDCWIGWCDPVPPPPPPCNTWPPTKCGGSPGPSGGLTDSIDPNDKVGPIGFNTSQFVNGVVPNGYSIYFENQSTATAPAQQVVITDQLDPTKIDLKSVSLGPITFGAQTINPPPGQNQFTSNLDLRPQQNLIARTVAKLDPDTGLLTWTFSSIDTQTLEATQDPSAGFLPPNTTPPAGQGIVAFSVTPKAVITTGATVCNQAKIVFDSNDPISTPTWCNTIDNTAPVSRVSALPASEVSSSFSVTWSGSDVGSGIAAFDVFVSDNGGPFTVWQNQATTTSAQFTGQNSHTYGFYSIASDMVGNIEPPKSTAEASTTVTHASAIATKTLLSASKPTSTPGSSVSFTANVTPLSGNGIPTGTVSFLIEGTSSQISLNNSGTATFNTSSLSIGSHVVTATYGGDANFAPSTSAPLTETITALFGDLNGDGVVNCADLAIVKASFGKKLGQTGFDSRADVNGDGVVNILDLSSIAKLIPAGTTCP